MVPCVGVDMLTVGESAEFAGELARKGTEEPR